MSKNPLAGFPPQFLQIIADYKQGKMPEPIVCTDKAMAVNMRHRFHRFRRAITELGLPGAHESWGLYLRLEENKVLFLGMPAGMETTAPPPDAEVHVPGIDSRIESGPDEHDAKLMELLGIRKQEEQGRAPESRAECNHEWDATGSFCLLCRVPKP